GAETYTLDDLLEQQEHDYEAESHEDYAGAGTGTGVGFDQSDWRLVLINKQHPIPEDYDFKLGTFTSGMRCDERVIEDLLLMMQAAKKDGLNLVVRSPYRTSDHQEDNFNDRIKSYMRQGLSYMDAYKATSRVITVPGCSEHEVGLALDITSDTFIPLLQGFADTEEGKWLEEHSHEYGFTLRYPSGKEYITGIEYEPWHFRYVGREAAAIMKDEELCLEEFWDKYL
ncbi:MAG: M15 family metallopeptidase, partial [Lachnospiraceae bacterium]|nr:M15 family metallopeptidase [Lachnospiraceae bacterium]